MVTADAYRLTPAEGAEKLLEKKRKIFEGVRRKWEERPRVAKEEPEEQIEEESEESEMGKKVAKKAVKKEAVKKEAAEKVGGIFRVGTALAFLYEVFEDEKAHSKKKVLADLAKKFGCKGLQGEWRIRRFREKGEALGAYALTLDSEEGTLQLKFGKGDKKAPAKKAAAKATKKASKAEDKAGAPKDGKATKAVASLIRRTLAGSGKSWTKNKLVEHLSEEFNIEPDDTRAAIKNELKSGGITEDDGVLELV